MASSDGEQSKGRLLSIPKEGERIIEPTRRPDGTLRKAIRIRAGYVPQDEVAIYQSKGALMRKSEPEVPPGYDPEALDNKPKTKSAKRNERRKEKRQQQQAALASSTDEGKDVDTEEVEVERVDELPSTQTNKQKENVENIAEQISSISISKSPRVVSTSADATESSKSESSAPDIDKKIRALKKKMRLAEAQIQADSEKLKPEQQERMTKIEGWREELKLLQVKKAALAS